MHFIPALFLLWRRGKCSMVFHPIIPGVYFVYNNFHSQEAVEADYIEETEYSMAEIAGMLGYDNPSKFAAAFRSVVGCSPREYKKSSERMEHLTLLRNRRIKSL